MTVAYLGPQGSFSEQAALEHFGHAVQKLPCPSFDEVFRAVEAGQADVAWCRWKIPPKAPSTAAWTCC